MFTSTELFPGIHQITDAMGVCMTLLVGRERALLFDTGYGTEDVAAYIRTVTALPLTVVLSHAHHDHALGACWFENVFLSERDFPFYADYTSVARRIRIADQARGRGLQVAPGFVTAVYTQPKPLAEEILDLGGLHARIVHCPGHTPGSAVLIVPEYALLLSADNWNPCTWLFFPEAVPVQEYRRNMLSLLERDDFTRVLCSHRQGIFDRKFPERLVAALSIGNLETAKPNPELSSWQGIDPRRIDLDAENWFVFDYAKFRKYEENQS